MSGLVANFKQLGFSGRAVVVQAEVSPGHWPAAVPTAGLGRPGVRLHAGPPVDPPHLVVEAAQMGRFRPEPKVVEPLTGAPGSGLFRTFAAVPATDEALADFASRYGNLGVLSLPGRTVATGQSVRGEVVQVWRTQQGDMARAVELWDTLRDQNLRRVLALAWDAFRGRGDVGTVETLEDGWRWLGGYLRRGLAGVSPDMRPNEARPLSLQLTPHTLLEALWLQFALAVDGNREYRACPVCGLFFELDPAVARSNRHYCSDVCRSRAYRARKRSANAR